MVHRFPHLQALMLEPASKSTAMADAAAAGLSGPSLWLDPLVGGIPQPPSAAASAPEPIRPAPGGRPNPPPRNYQTKGTTTPRITSAPAPAPQTQLAASTGPVPVYLAFGLSAVSPSPEEGESRPVSLNAIEVYSFVIRSAAASPSDAEWRKLGTAALRAVARANPGACIVTSESNTELLVVGASLAGAAPHVPLPAAGDAYTLALNPGTTLVCPRKASRTFERLVGRFLLKQVEQSRPTPLTDKWDISSDFGCLLLVERASTRLDDGVVLRRTVRLIVKDVEGEEPLVAFDIRCATSASACPAPGKCVPGLEVETVGSSVDFVGTVVVPPAGLGGPAAPILIGDPYPDFSKSDKWAGKSLLEYHRELYPGRRAALAGADPKEAVVYVKKHNGEVGGVPRQILRAVVRQERLSAAGRKLWDSLVKIDGLDRQRLVQDIRRRLAAVPDLLGPLGLRMADHLQPVPADKSHQFRIDGRVCAGGGAAVVLNLKGVYDYPGALKENGPATFFPSNIPEGAEITLVPVIRHTSATAVAAAETLCRDTAEHYTRWARRQGRNLTFKVAQAWVVTEAPPSKGAGSLTQVAKDISNTYSVPATSAQKPVVQIPIVICVVPDDDGWSPATEPDGDDDDVEDSSVIVKARSKTGGYYAAAKDAFASEEIVTQMVYARNLGNPYISENIALGANAHFGGQAFKLKPGAIQKGTLVVCLDATRTEGAPIRVPPWRCLQHACGRATCWMGGRRARVTCGRGRRSTALCFQAQQVDTGASCAKLATQAAPPAAALLTRLLIPPFAGDALVPASSAVYADDGRLVLEKALAVKDSKKGEELPYVYILGVIEVRKW